MYYKLQKSKLVLLLVDSYPNGTNLVVKIINTTMVGILKQGEQLSQMAIYSLMFEVFIPYEHLVSSEKIPTTV